MKTILLIVVLPLLFINAAFACGGDCGATGGRDSPITDDELG